MGAYNIYEAKTAFSALVERAEKGEEVIIARAGKPVAKLVPIVSKAVPKKEKLRPFGPNFLGIQRVGDDFDDPLPDDVLRDFGYHD